MPTVIEDLKQLLEIDTGEQIYDAQLLLNANSGIKYLMNNGIPLSLITLETDNKDFLELKEGDYEIVLSWLNLYCLQRFDRTLMQLHPTATTNWIDNEMTNLLYHLKVIYGNSKNRAVMSG